MKGGVHTEPAVLVLRPSDDGVAVVLERNLGLVSIQRRIGKPLGRTELAPRVREGCLDPSWVVRVGDVGVDGPRRDPVAQPVGGDRGLERSRVGRRQRRWTHRSWRPAAGRRTAPPAGPASRTRSTRRARCRSRRGRCRARTSPGPALKESGPRRTRHSAGGTPPARVPDRRGHSWTTRSRRCRPRRSAARTRPPRSATKPGPWRSHRPSARGTPRCGFPGRRPGPTPRSRCRACRRRAAGRMPCRTGWRASARRRSCRPPAVAPPG